MNCRLVKRGSKRSDRVVNGRLVKMGSERVANGTLVKRGSERVVNGRPVKMGSEGVVNGVGREEEKAGTQDNRLAWVCAYIHGDQGRRGDSGAGGGGGVGEREYEKECDVSGG